MTELLNPLQEAIIQRLCDRQELVGVPVLARQPANLDRCIAESAQSGAGVHIIVLQPLPRKVTPVTAGPVFEDILVTVRVTENAVVNNTGLSALGLAELIAKWLHLWQPTVTGISSALELQNTDPWDSVVNSLACDSAVIELKFVTAGSLAGL